MGRYLAADLRVESKPDRTPVTETDRAVEQALRERLAAARPGDEVVGEEFGASDGETRRRWIIDPIDGTASYLRGMPTWSTLIALEQEGEPLVAVVSMPAISRRWWASRGGGAWTEGRQLTVSRVAELSEAQLCWSGIESWDLVGRPEAILALCRQCWRTRGIGDAWQYMLVAEGAAEVALDPEVSEWDLAAPRLIVEEAGGRFTDLGGVATVAGGDALATNGLLHEAALAIVGR